MSRILRNTMCVAVATATALFYASRPMYAQVPAATPADSVVVQKNILHKLFAGITLTPRQRTRAQAVIAKTYHQQEALMPITSCAGRQTLVALQDQRDSMLRAMLTSDSDRAKFDRHAAAVRPEPCVQRD